MTWREISDEAKSGRRVLVKGGTWVRGNRAILPQIFPSLVTWQDGEFVVCDNEGDRAFIRSPKRWCPLPADDEE